MWILKFLGELQLGILKGSLMMYFSNLTKKIESLIKNLIIFSFFLHRNQYNSTPTKMLCEMLSGISWDSRKSLTEFSHEACHWSYVHFHGILSDSWFFWWRLANSYPVQCHEWYSCHVWNFVVAVHLSNAIEFEFISVTARWHHWNNNYNRIIIIIKYATQHFEWHCVADNDKS